MKNSILLTVFILLSLNGFAQMNQADQGDHVTRQVIILPNGEEAVTIFENEETNILKLSTVDNFYKYEILKTSNRELVHRAANKGKICEIDNSELADGQYTIKIYTTDIVFTSYFTISN